MHREEEGRWREERVGWGRKEGEWKGKGMEGRGRREGKEGRRDGKGGQGSGRNGNWGEVCVMVFGGDGRPCVHLIPIGTCPTKPGNFRDSGKDTSKSGLSQKNRDGSTITLGVINV
jgi:hypothetical protein